MNAQSFLNVNTFKSTYGICILAFYVVTFGFMNTHAASLKKLFNTYSILYSW